MEDQHRVTIIVERFDWGIRDTLDGEVNFEDVLRGLEKSWAELDWDDVYRRLSICKPGLTFHFNEKDPTILARILRPSLSGKHSFRYALVVPPGEAQNLAYAEEYAHDVDQTENAVATVFNNEAEAMEWLLKDFR